jgi:hypothetical protein
LIYALNMQAATPALTGISQPRRPAAALACLSSSLALQLLLRR